jgi:2-dehydro-3-deoxygalactonokinase
MSHDVFVDWGTTNFRAYLVSDSGEVVASKTSGQGVKSAAGRFEAILSSHLGDWLDRHAVGTICCAGTIGGDLGWRTVDMVPCPASLPDLAQGLCSFAVPGLPNIVIIPGVCCFDDADRPGMMRGEEVLLFGCIQILSNGDGVFCFPGTHSKWVTVAAGAVREIRTSMTGECFDLLQSHSVLASSLTGWSGEVSHDDFLAGVARSREVPNPLQSAFSVRSMHLQGRLPSPAARASYLSGLLIGAEVGGVASSWPDAAPRRMTLVTGRRLAHLYDLACRAFDLQTTILDDESCFVKGAAAILALSSAAHQSGL